MSEGVIDVFLPACLTPRPALSAADKGISSDNDFEWLCQLRYYWEKNNMVLRMINSTCDYGYEYLGNSPRLVVTPLTDRWEQRGRGARFRPVLSPPLPSQAATAR